MKDVLSDIVDTVELKGALYFRTDFSPSFAISVPSYGSSSVPSCGAGALSCDGAGWHGGLVAPAVGAYALPLRRQTTTRVIQRVEIKGFAFEPSRVEVPSGDIVEWLNRDFAPHTATADNNHRWDTGSLRNKASGRWTTTQPGEFVYHCTFHPHMKGVIIVLA